MYISVYDWILFQTTFFIYINGCQNSNFQQFECLHTIKNALDRIRVLVLPNDFATQFCLTQVNPDQTFKNANFYCIFCVRSICKPSETLEDTMLTRMVHKKYLQCKRTKLHKHIIRNKTNIRTYDTQTQLWHSMQ